MISVSGDCALLPLDARQLAACLQQMLGRLHLEADLELECLRDADIMDLNTAHMVCHGPTNILSFPSGEAGFLGSLALSVDCLRREARLYGQNITEYCHTLLAHGLAHLLGYDHGPDMDAVCAVMLCESGDLCSNEKACAGTDGRL